MVIPDEPLYAAPCATMHCGGSPNEIARPLMGMVIEVASTESHRNPNSKVTRREPPYIARARKKNRKAVAETVIG